MNYKVISHIATGGYGKVEKVQGDDGILYAKKTFEVDNKVKTDGFEENARKRFIQEAKRQFEFSHKNIVPVKELFVQHDPPFFIMPLAEGSLDSDVKTGFLPSNKFPSAIFDILAGLEELHSIDIYHRDLKPSNVLRYANVDGSFYYAIGDFGLMSFKQGPGITMLTATTMVKSSDFYTAPEITQHLYNGSVASDIYSVGCIIHDFVGLKDSRFACNEIVDTSSYGDILAICTRQDPNKRFKSVALLRDALAGVDLEVMGPKTEGSTIISNYLDSSGGPLLENQLEEIISYLQSSIVDKYDKINFLLEISLDNIRSIKQLSNSMQFTLIYCELIRNGSFSFNSCDAFASRIYTLIENEGIASQANGIMALLFLGTNHNRFYVERMFVSMVGQFCDEKLAKRLKLEFSINDRVCDALSHLTYSINFSVNQLHPFLKEFYCKQCIRE